MTITQEEVNLFADATGDHQWIHVDPERAAAGPFGTTIAHGFMTLALLPRLQHQMYTVKGVKLAINYGLNKVRFPAPVPVGSRVRATSSLVGVEDLGNGTVQATVSTTVEVEDQPSRRVWPKASCATSPEATRGQNSAIACSRRWASQASACARRVGMCCDGKSVVTGWYSRSVRRATVILCSSVAPSAMPSDSAASIILTNGISSETPSAPCRCMARCTTSCSTWGIATLTAAMSRRTFDSRGVCR